MQASKFFPAVAVMAVLSVCSCRTTPPQPMTSAAAVNIADANTTMQHRAEQFRQYIVKHSVRTGVVIDVKSQAFYSGQSEKLAARCQMLGMTDAYIVIPEPEKLGDRKDQIRSLLLDLHRAGIKCYASLDLGYLYHYNRKTSLNPFAGDLASQAIAPVLDYNSGWGMIAEERFDGIECILLPNRISYDERSREASLYKWNENNYGPGGENNILISQTVDFMKRIRSAAGDLPVVQNVGCEFADKTCSGELSGAGVNAFLDFCDYLVLDDVGNNPEEIEERIATELQNATRKGSLSVRIITSRDYYSDEAAVKSFTRRPWLQVVKQLYGISRKAGKKQSFRGLVFDNYAGLETIWERTR